MNFTERVFRNSCLSKNPCFGQIVKKTLGNSFISIRYGLSCSKDKEILKNYLHYGISDDVRVQDKHYLFNQVASTEYGRDVVWQFVKENWNWFYTM